jgi:hypothetical protein
MGKDETAESIEYGANNKRIVFTDNDHRHAKLLIRLRHDGLQQAQFFRHLITGYIDGDERIQDFVDSIKPQSQVKKVKSKKARQQGLTAQRELGLDEQQVDNIFDLIAREHPEL